MRTKYSIGLFLISGFLFSAVSYGQERKDSSVVVSTERERVVQYGYRPTVFNIVATPKLDGFTASETEKTKHLSSLLSKTVKSEGANGVLRAPQMRAVPSSDYAVGSIPLQEGVSPSGARTYSIPITTAPDAKFAPQISLSYNSQAGVGLVGCGWELSGISKISLINHNIYYHGKAKAAQSQDIDAVFALDGIPLVQNTDPATRTEFPLVTATGFIIARKNTNSSGYITGFDVRFPNGVQATYSLGYDVPYNYPSYPVAEMTDKDGNVITFSYLKEPTNGLYRIEKIKYNLDANGHPVSEIDFSYNYHANLSEKYYAGKLLNYNNFLARVESKNNGVLLNKMLCTYTYRDNVYLLSKVSCSDGSSSLPPLKFDYGESHYWEEAENASLERENTFQFLSSTFTDVDCIYRRGKFVKNSFNDGLIIYPAYTNYDIRESYWGLFSGDSYLFGSPISENQAILFVPQIGDDVVHQVDASIVAEAGFQTIEAVDVNGDGVDELVKINYNGVSGNKTSLKLSIYNCNASGIPTLSTTFTIPVTGTITSGNYTSPYRREYYWGDFNGNGHAQLLSIAYNNNGYNYSQLCYASLIDLNSHALLSESVLFDYSLADGRNVLVVDMDGDGRSELCRAHTGGFDVFRLQQGNSFAVEQHFDIPTSAEVSDARTCFTDLNADGYLDILSPTGPSGTYWYRYSYTGEVMTQQVISLESGTEDNRVMFIDVNQDSYPDMVKISSSSIGVRMNLNGCDFGGFRLSASPVTDTKGIVPCSVMDYSGMSSFIKVDGFNIYHFGYSCLSSKIRYLKASEDSFGNRIENTYEYYPSFSRYWMTETYNPSASNGYSKRALPIYILNAENGLLALDNTFYKSITYSYYDPVVHNQGLGFCGYAQIKEYDVISGHVTMTAMYHNPEKRGVLTKVEKRNGYQDTSPLFFTLENTYDTHRTTYGKLNPRLTKSIENNTLTGIETTTNYTYGSYDLPTTIRTSRRIGTGGSQTEKLTRGYQNNITTSKYVLGLITEESVEKEGDGNATLTWKERSVKTYDSNGHPLTSCRYVGRYGSERIISLQPLEPVIDTATAYSATIRPSAIGDGSNVVVPADPGDPIDPGDPVDPGIPIDPTVPVDTATFHPFEPIGDLVFYDATNLVSETHWQYDSHGNVVSETTAPYGATEFVGNTCTYDSDGRYLLTKTDALGHTTTYSGYNKFGKPTTVKDYRNRTTTFAYDAWGNLVTTTSPDGTVEQTTVAWGGAGLYTVTRTATGKPETVIHYDALSREIRSGVKRFDGQWQWTDREYDSKGRLSRTSLPYRGTTAAYWNTYAYDEYNRPVSLTEASGKISTWSYSGTSVTTVKDGITSTSTTDANGNVISVADAGGTITYVLRDDGQPSKITAPGNVSTTFTYDDYGRRTKIVDPSAGTQTDAYVWNADGSSEYTHTNPNGTVKTYKDKYGRTMMIERPGEYNTTFTYNTYGLLSSEQSTNGTGIEYTYDGFDRVVTSKETIPDGKWLRKVYNYGTASVLNSIQYISQSGPITTENYTYANGHNTGIILPNGMDVWHLTAENDLGMPTEIESGDITREYGYTAFGMPTYRRMDGGELQDFTYNFDISTGNLLSRSDGVNGQTETFGYDNLNRLIAIGSRQISYDNKGNILSMDGVGAMTYGSSLHPYRITTLAPEEDGLVPDRQQIISYTCYNRPSVLTEGGRSAAFTYNGDGGRVKMYVADGATPVLSRYYIGGRYEYDQTPSGSKERLYLGGDAYSAPMVLQRENNGSWTAYNIGRDYLGNITQIATLDGTLVVEYSYDPWGRLRNPETLEIYASGSEPELFLGRGFTGHEHLTWFGLVNMNARLYDPLLGRFLSPDPYVQAPDFTQNFNRYSYALNNPLKYTDEDGEWIHIVIGAILGGTGNLIANWSNCKGFWEYFASFTIGAVAGAAVAATGGAAAAAGGGFWATAGVIGVGATGGAVTGATGDIIRQTGENFAGIDNVDWKSVGISAVAGGVSGAASAGVGVAMSGVHIPVTINGTTIESPILSSSIAGAATGAAGHIAGGTIAGVLWGDSFDTAFRNSFEGIGTSILMGVAFSAASTTAYCIADGVNPLNGRALKSAGKIYTPARNLSEQLAFEEAMNNEGTVIIPANDIRSYEWQGWDKMQYVYRNNNQNAIGYLDYGHDIITVHYYQKTVNGITYKSGFKFKY